MFKHYMTLSPLKYRKTLNTVTYTNKPEYEYHPEELQDVSSDSFPGNQDW